MRIEKILNNNVVITRNELNQEMIVMGKGLAYKKKTGDKIAEKCIDKKFQLADDRVAKYFQKLVQEIPLKYIEWSYEIIEDTKKMLRVPLNESIYISLTDHLYTAIKRNQKGIELPNVLLYDIKQLFPKEFQIGKRMLEKMLDDHGIELSENEAGFIALHLVNAQTDRNQLENMYLFTKTLQDILNIVRYYYQMTFDEESVAFFRFVTHLRFFLTRIMNTSKPVDSDVAEELLQVIQRKYPVALQCVKKIVFFLDESLDYQVSQDEIVYLTIHVARLRHEYRLKN
ncbi:BglG family transcription antiterminator LicT [Enterococcus durans]|uniref:BglG family transcription antiterminator LicT n=1 Tax=Enterococcus durans TaxID=53345 RepID=UPI0009C0D8B9|nr:PRD domain-containing protein [Enterococcus durans]OQO81477.1 RNA-binding protein [Enterococcus durans]